MSDVERINALTTNARNTWFVLLAALVFVGITLMSVEHIDFYGVNRATTLPVINVSVPTRAFFIAAPVLIAAIFGYFHLYLIRLWDALSDAPPRHDGTKLGDAIAPWLVTDAALHLRHRLRRDNCTTHRPLEGAAMLLNIALAWGFGLFILYWLWWSFLPARHFVQTLPAAAACVICTIVGATSLVMLLTRMRRRPTGARRFLSVTALQTLALVAGLALAVVETRQQTEGPKDRLAGLAMPDEAIVDRPPGWLPHAEARKDYFATWCNRTGARCVLDDLSQDERRAFNTEWRTRRTAALGDLQKSDWHKVTATKPNFSHANLPGSFLSGANLIGAQMEGANLIGAQMEGADLRGAQMKETILESAQMEGADLRSAWMNGANLKGAQMGGVDLRSARMEGADLEGAQMEGANLRGARIEGADLEGAQMEGADLRGAQMEGADLEGAQMERSDFRGAQMEGVILRRAQMEWANLSRAEMEGADLSEAQMEGADLSRAQMEGANLSRAQMKGADLIEAQMEGANLSRAQMEGADLRGAQMEGADLEEAQMEGADLRSARMEGANLEEAQMEGADLRSARMEGVNLEGADLEGAQMEGANLSRALLTGTSDLPNVLASTNLSAGTNNGGALRFVDLTKAVFDARTDFRNAFLDGSVTMTDAFRAQMGNPCQWATEVLSEAEFYGRWRGWVEAGPLRWAITPPTKWRDVEAIPPGPGCTWKTGPIVPEVAAHPVGSGQD